MFFLKKVLTTTKSSSIIMLQQKVVQKRGGETMNLKEIRKEKKLSQEKLAKMLCVSQQSVAKWENEQSLPRAELLPKIASILGCSVDELLTKQVSKCSNRNFV